MKRFLKAAFAVSLIGMFCTCAFAKQYKVGIVLGLGGLGDKSFNDSAYRGLQEAKQKLNIKFKYVEPTSNAENEQYLRMFAQGGFDLTIATGFLMQNAVQKVAKEFPNSKFAVIDCVVNEPNVASLVFNEEQGSFLAGALAAMVSKTAKIGFVGGAKVPLIQKFEKGYTQGAKYIKPKIKVLVTYTSGANPFGDPVQGKQNALSEIKQGADVVFHAAGGTGVGVIEAAKEKHVFAIGCDSNQDAVAKGTVITSAIKNVDKAVFLTVQDLVNGKFTAGVHTFGIKEDGVSLTDFQYSKKVVTPEIQAKLKKLSDDIASGKIKVKI